MHSRCLAKVSGVWSLGVSGGLGYHEAPKFCVPLFGFLLMRTAPFLVKGTPVLGTKSW